MPIPLLLIPIIAAASGSTIAAVIGAALGGLTIGGGASTFFWWFFNDERETNSKSEQLTQHLDLTQQHILETQKNIQSIDPKLEALCETVTTASTSMDSSTQQLAQVSAELERTKNDLESALFSANKANKELEDSHQLYQELLQQTTAKNQDSVSQISTLIELLQAKENDLRKATNEMVHLRDTLTHQVTLINSLELKVEELIQNKEQQDALIIQFETRVTRLTSQVNFFKQVASSALDTPTAESPTL